ncbi:Fructose-1,6-bisphosphatase/inositol-1-monophosphatase [subsurface metagenome]
MALVEDGQPIIGAVVNPQRKEIFTAIKGKGAYLNGELIHVKEKLEEKLEIVASRSEIKRGEWENLAKQAKIIPSVAAGKVDATFSLIPKHEWDIAAGCLLVEEAGGLISDKFHQSYIFNRKNTLVNSIVGTSEVSNEIIFEIIEKEMK